MIIQLHQRQEAPKVPRGPYTHLGTRCPWARLWSIPPATALLKDATSRAVLNLIIIKPAGGGETPGQHSPAQREAEPSTPNCPAAPSTSPAAPFPLAEARPAIICIFNACVNCFNLIFMSGAPLGRETRPRQLLLW